MSMKQIRNTYKVPAKRGARIEYSGDKIGDFIYGFLSEPKKGTIVSAGTGHIRVRMDESGLIKTIHPTRKVKYL